MKIRALKDGMTLSFPSGDSMVVGRTPVEVPKEFESDVRKALGIAFGIEEVDKPKPVAKAAALRETTATEKAK